MMQSTGDRAGDCPSFEGSLLFFESTSASPLHFGRSESPLRTTFVDASSSAWIKRWCTLQNGTLDVFPDRTAAIARPERSLRSISLQDYQQLKTSGDYDAYGNGQWELTLLGERKGSNVLPQRPRAVPRSSTSASLSNAFERGASAVAAAATSPLRSVPKRNIPALHPRYVSENGEGSKGGNYPATWSNKFASKSKRLYQLMAGSGSTQSLTEQVNRSMTDLTDESVVSLPSVASNTTLRNKGSSSTINTLSRVGHNANSSTLATTLILRALDAQSMAQWADAIARSLYVAARSSRPHGSPNSPLLAPTPTLAHAASLSTLSAHLPPHARQRRVRQTSGEDEFVASFGFTATNSSLMSAAMASRRKREDSIVLHTESKTKVADATPKISPVQAISSPAAPPNPVRQFTAADKFIKAKRRLSLEMLAGALGNRRSTDTDTLSRPTTSSGNSTRSSICCAGEAARMNMERINGSVDFTPNAASTTSHQSFPSHIVATVRRSTSRRRESTSSLGTRSSTHAPVAMSAAFAAHLAPSNVTDLPPSSLEDNSSSERSPGLSSLSTLFTPSPRTPEVLLNDLSVTEAEDQSYRATGTYKSNKAGGSLGLNILHQENGTQTPLLFNPLYRPFVRDAVIIENPSKEDLAVKGWSKEEEGEGQITGVKIPLRQSSKLSTSPSMPLLNQTYAKQPSKTEQEQNVAASPSRFATFTKFSIRRPLLTSPVRHRNTPPPSSSSSTALAMATLPRAMSPLQRASMKKADTFTSTSGTQNQEGTRPALQELASRMQSAAIVSTSPPVVERILPPEEMIATFDRLRTGLNDNGKGDSTTPSSQHQVSLQPKTSQGSLKQGITTGSRLTRPQTSPNAEGTAPPPFSGRKPRDRRHLNVLTDAWQASEPLVELSSQSLPAPPRLHRKSKYIALATAQATQQDGKSEDDDKENDVEITYSRDTIIETAKIQQQKGAPQPLRTSISDSFSFAITGRI